jgi:hypothetical protein
VRNPDTGGGRELYRAGSQSRLRNIDSRGTTPDERYTRTKYGLEIGRLRLENIARIVGLVSCVILIVVVVALATVTALCAVRRYRWPTIAAPSGLGVACAGVLYRLLSWIGNDGRT